MFFEGIMLGTITMAGFAILFKRLPKGAQVFCMRHPLFTDLMLVIVFYTLMGFTLTAHVAAATMSLQAMFALEIMRYPEKYTFIHDAIDNAKSAWNTALKGLQDINDKYKTNKDKPELTLV